jgi:hypothetical protein
MQKMDVPVQGYHEVAGDSPSMSEDVDELFLKNLALNDHPAPAFRDHDGQQRRHILADESSAFGADESRGFIHAVDRKADIIDGPEGCHPDFFIVKIIQEHGFGVNCLLNAGNKKQGQQNDKIFFHVHLLS